LVCCDNGKEVLENNKQQVFQLYKEALQVNIIAAGGQPGENPTIRIRGIGSINASAEPLIILDGASLVWEFKQ
jgi:hypothetical protein